MLKRIAVGAFLALAVAFSARAETQSWRPLFNGKDLSGWRHVGPGEMVVEGGLIRTRGGMACSTEEWEPGPEWNTMEITLDDPRTVVTLNGVKVTDYTEG